MLDSRGIVYQPGTHVTLMIGVVAEHDSQEAKRVLDELTALLSSWHWAPLVWREIKDDCLVAPPERGNHHLEIRWLQM